MQSTLIYLTQRSLGMDPKEWSCVNGLTCSRNPALFRNPTRSKKNGLTMNSWNFWLDFRLQMEIDTTIGSRERKVMLIQHCFITADNNRHFLPNQVFFNTTDLMRDIAKLIITINIEGIESAENVECSLSNYLKNLVIGWQRFTYSVQCCFCDRNIPSESQYVALWWPEWSAVSCNGPDVLLQVTRLPHLMVEGKLRSNNNLLPWKRGKIQTFTCSIMDTSFLRLGPEKGAPIVLRNFDAWSNDQI